MQTQMYILEGRTLYIIDFRAFTYKSYWVID